MALKRRASKKIPDFDIPVSYLINENRMRFRDALNVFSNQGKLETRFGRSRLNSSPLFDDADGTAIQSLSFFKSAAGVRYILAKVGKYLYAIDSSGASELIYYFCPEDKKHRGITLGRGESSRHIVTFGGSQMFQFDGTSFSFLGQVPPTTPPTLAAIAGSLTNASYKVCLTFYATTTGFETNAGQFSNVITTSGQALRVTAIPTGTSNHTIDKVRIYLQNTASIDGPLFAGEVNLGVTTYDITANPSSTQVPPIGQDMPFFGAKFALDFNSKLLAFGSDQFPNDVFFSEPYTPDAFNNGSAPGRQVLYIPGDGKITAGAIGLYNNSVLDPYLVICKDRSTHIYSEIGGEPKFITLSNEIGCISHDTMKVKNGTVYFLSDQGWRVVNNGSFVLDEKGNPLTLGNGDVDDIFRSPGFTFEINRARLGDTFSVYYSALDQYITWVAEGARNDFSKAYVYEFRSGGFKPYEFASSATCACVGEDGDGAETVFMADADGIIYKHSAKETRVDEDKNGDAVIIPAFAQFAWFIDEDMDATFNYRNFLIRRLVGGGDVQLKVCVNYTMDNERTFTIKGPSSGFILDQSQIDIDEFGQNDRSVISSVLDLNTTCESIMLGFYQNEIGKNIGLVSAQLDYSQNRSKR